MSATEPSLNNNDIAIKRLTCKGCFAYKGKVKRVLDEEYLVVTDDAFVKKRFRLYRQLWDSLQVETDVLRADLNSKIFDDLIAFSAFSHKDKYKNNMGSFGEIPTAVLITGVNTPDHSVMFSSLEEMLKAKVTPLVARVMAKDCSRVASLIGNIIQQFTNDTRPTDDDDSSDMEDSCHKDATNLDCSPVKLKVTIKKRRAMTMSALVSWYKKTYCTDIDGCPSPTKKKKNASSPKSKLAGKENHGQEQYVDGEGDRKHPHLVIMLEDVENMNPNVLQDFISLCSSYTEQLPIVLILGIATAVTAIHQLLPSSVSSLLCMEKFQAPPASRYLGQLLDKIIMTAKLPFKLGPKMFHFLLDTFLYHDFSILNFIMGFQISMMEHFLTNPLSLLCCPVDEVDPVTSSLSHVQLEDLRRQPAFMRYVEATKGPSQAKLLTDDSATKKLLAQELKSMHLAHSKLFPALRFLHCLSVNLPKYPLGRQLRELYSVCLTQDICACEGYNHLFSLLRMMAADDLCQLLSQCLDTIKDNQDELEDIGKLCEDVDKFIYRLQHVEEESVDNEEADDVDAEGGRILPQRAKLYELKEKLQSLSSKRRKSPYERMREEILDVLHQHLKQLLVCPMSHPLHEIFYFNDLAAIKDHLKAAPRCSVQRALTQPGKYLNCPCCQCDIDSIVPSMPDLCIVYKLHLECGTLVNLYDWLQAFVTVVTSSEAKGRRKGEKAKKASTELRARFIRAVSELQFLGFIKATRRKTDHVTRLTW